MDKNQQTMIWRDRQEKYQSELLEKNW